MAMDYRKYPVGMKISQSLFLQEARGSYVAAAVTMAPTQEHLILMTVVAATLTMVAFVPF